MWPSSQGNPAESLKEAVNLWLVPGSLSTGVPKAAFLDGARCMTPAEHIEPRARYDTVRSGLSTLAK